MILDEATKAPDTVGISSHVDEAEHFTCHQIEPPENRIGRPTGSRPGGKQTIAYEAAAERVTPALVGGEERKAEFTIAPAEHGERQLDGDRVAGNTEEVTTEREELEVEPAGPGEVPRLERLDQGDHVLRDDIAHHRDHALGPDGHHG
jgi:hypothetical protein